MEKYFTVFSVSAFKFIFGPLTGYLLKLNLLETAFFTVTGMMFTVVVITYAGGKLRAKIIKWFFSKRRIFSPKTRKIVRIWRSYGVWGVAFLTPLLFSPPIGAAIAVSFGEKKFRILYTMLVSGIFWGIFFSVVFILGGDQVAKYFT